KRLEKIRVGVGLTTDRVIIETSAMKVKAIGGLLRASIEAVDEINERIEQVWSRHQDRELFESLPGAGSALAPRLAAACGEDRRRWAAAQEIQQLSGIAPVTRRSGRSWEVARRKACPTFMKQSFQEFAQWSIGKSRWAKAYYQQQRKKGKKH